MLQIQPVAEDGGACPTVISSVTTLTGVESTSSMSKTTITLTVPFSRTSDTATGTASAIASYKPDSAAAEAAVPGVGMWMVVAIIGALASMALELW